MKFAVFFTYVQLLPESWIWPHQTEYLQPIQGYRKRSRFLPYGETPPRGPKMSDSSLQMLLNHDQLATQSSRIVCKRLDIEQKKSYA